jgi:hypothetical protein
MQFCKNCGAAVDNKGTQEEVFYNIFDNACLHGGQSLKYVHPIILLVPFL